jgi:hypothetical protein
VRPAHFVRFLLLVTDSDWRFLVWVGSNAPAQTRNDLLQDLRTDSPGALRLFLRVVLVWFDELRCR